jgi:hypothetical protein
MRNLGTLFTKATPEPAAPVTAQPDRPHLAALRTCEREMDAIKSRESLWAKRIEAQRIPIDALPLVRAKYGAAVQALADAQATIGELPLDIPRLEADLNRARIDLDAASQRAEVAQRVLESIDREQQPDRDRFAQLLAQHGPLHFNARVERLGELMPRLIATEAAYRANCIEAYGAVRAVNEIAAKHGMTQLAEWALGSWFTPRPWHPAFNSFQPPTHEEIYAQMLEAAQRIAEEV